MIAARVTAACALACAGTIASAAPQSVAPTPKALDTQSLEQSVLDPRQVWGLTYEEWSRFEALQAGPRGYWSPQLDPLTTLGVEADTDQERQRYAELQVKLEAKRAERELAYQQAYTAAWARLYPGLLPVQGMDTASANASAPVARESLFVEADCSPCATVAKRLQDQGITFDLYLVGSNGDDEQLRQWAKAAGILPAKVQARQITLNHDRGRWFSLGAHGALPARLQQVEGQWQRIE